MAYDGSLLFDAKVDSTGFNKGVREINKQASNVTSTFKNVGVAIASAFAVQKLVEFGKQSVNLASDLQEVQNVVDVSFGDMSYKMEQFAETAIESFGLSRLEAKRTGSTFMAMATGMQFAQDTASDMSLSLTALSADMASFYNASQSEAKTALSSIYTGETETLKRYGVLITEVNLQEYARQRGITKSINAMTQQEKVLLRYNYVMNATKLAQGDFARTSDSWANQTRVLGESWKELCVTLGQVLIPVLSKAIPYVTAFVRILNEGLLALAKLWGIDLPDYSNQTKGINAMGTGLKDVSTGANKAKKALQNLAGFDELNVIGKKASETGDTIGSVGAGGGGNLGLDVPKFDTSNIKKQSDEIYNSMKEWIDKTAKKLKEFQPILETIGATLLSMWAVGKIADFIKWIGKVIKVIGGLKIVKGIGKLVNAFMLGFDTAFGAGAGTFKSLTAGAKAFKSALSPLAKIMLTVGASVASFFIAKNVFKDVAEGTRSWSSALAITIPLVGGLAVAIGFLVNPIAGVIVGLIGLVGALVGYSDGVNEIARQKIAGYFQEGEIAVGEFATQVDNLTQKMTENESKFLTSTQSLNDNRTNSIALSDEIKLLTADMRNLGGASYEESQKINKAFSALATETKNYVTQANNDLKLYVIANKELLESQGVNVNAMISDMNKGTENTIGKFDELTKVINDISSKPIKTEIDLSKLEWAEQELLKYQQLTVDTTSEVEKLNSMLTSYSTTKFGDSESAEKAFTSIATSAAEALDSLEKTKEQTLKTIDSYTLPEDAKQRLRNDLISVFEVKENDIIAAVAPTMQMVTQQYNLLVSKTEATIKEARTKGFNPVVDLFGYDNNVKKEMEKTGVKATEDVLNSAKLNLSNNKLKSEVVDQLLNFDLSKAKPKGEEIGKDLIVGEQKGINDNTGLATTAISESSNAVIDKAKSDYDTHSPSKVFLDIGMNLMQGLANGIADNMALASNQLQTLFNDMMKKLDSFETEFQRRIRNLFQSTSQSANSFTVGADGKVTYKEPKMFNAPIPKLATGTVVPARMGEFLAILGDNKKETEVVSPLSTIEKAVENVMGRTGGQGGVYVIHTHVHLNGHEIGEAVSEHNARELIKGNGRRR